MSSKVKRVQLQQQQSWHQCLPPELICALILFVPPPGTVWTTGRLLITSGILFRLINDGKNANIWRNPYTVRQREASFLDKVLAPLGKLSLLPRTHCAILPFNSFLTMSQYVHVSGLMCRFQVMLLLDQTKFPHHKMTDLNVRLCKRLNVVEYKEQMINNFRLKEFDATYEQTNEYVCLTIGYDQNFAADIGDECMAIKNLLSLLVVNMDDGFPDEFDDGFDDAEVEGQS